MSDAWTLDTPGGPYTLNQTFTAPKYQPGSVSGPGALRRDDRNTYQRSGDGLATPGPLTLIGRVWRDDQDQSLMLQELEAIRAAVATCTTVTRSNNAGEYVYDSLAGGATPEVTPDGLGGWVVRLDLWPGRAAATFVPAGGDQPAFIAAATAANGIAPTATGSVTVPLATQPGDLLLLSISSSRIALPGGSLTINGGGWGLVAGSTAIIGSQQAVFQRRAQEGDAGSTVAFTLGGSGTTARYTAVVSAYRPVADTAIEASAAGSAGGVAPSLTVTAVPGTLVCFWSSYTDGTSDTTTISAPAGMSTRVAVPGPIADAPGSFKVTSLIADEVIGSAGPTGARAASSDSIWFQPVSIFLAAGETP